LAERLQPFGFRLKIGAQSALRGYFYQHKSLLKKSDFEAALTSRAIYPRRILSFQTKKPRSGVFAAPHPPPIPQMLCIL
jgi:hypothetical protein